ncbi:FAD-linked oxidase C-terminal domain-containing protein [Halomicrococcus sp. NG-SE-24]|uniref:FAD-binding and (Fe-S)-binding domain-containing protein n=1 Tax=Halomicrococcus sp. NG-SE-24 TaxID=3436928 RepID=UPI003D99C523
MATEKPRPGLSDFETFREAQNLEHEDVEEYASLAADLRKELEGEVRFDEYSQVLYATDGSIFRARPAGVVIPHHLNDVQKAVQIAFDHDVPILARGTGSSLGGQAVGPGCVILDMSKYMNDIIDIDPEGQEATIQPGVVQDDLDEHLDQYGLKFAPDPASSNRATVGGGIGNNSTGAHSVRYEITDEYTEELKVVLSDGSVIQTREIVLDSDEWDDIVSDDTLEADIYRTVRSIVEDNEAEIEKRYPDLKRNVSGYNLHKVIYENKEGQEVINLSKLLVGSESTLGVVVEATVSLVPKPDETALALYCFDDLIDTMEAVPEALEFDVSAVELMDDEVFRLARESAEFSQYAEPIPERAAAALMIEFDSELVDDFEVAISETNDHFVETGHAFDVIEAYTEEEQQKLWKLRKAAIPLLMSLDGDPKPYPFIEDATVPPEELSEYVQSFENILVDHDTSAAYFAHAGSGTLHIRPILNLKENEGIQRMRSITDEVTDLVVEHHGSFSGEHGDGLARTEFNPKMYGPQLWDAFKEVKETFDPGWNMNPGKVVYRDENPTDMRDDLRYGAEYSSIQPQTKLDFDDEGSFSELVELCNGCGNCRQTDGDVMCPTYRVSKDEMESTRGRANMLREAISGELPEGEMFTERFQEEVLDLCIGCKGCMNDCPTGVDLAKLKTEVKHQYHQQEEPSIREKIFANIEPLSALGSRFAPVSNWLPKLPGARTALERFVGISKERKLPPFQSESFEEWFESRGPKVSLSEADDKVLLFPDTYTNYNYSDAGKAAVAVLEAADVHVELPDNVAPSGRPAFSKGFLDLAEDRAQQNVEALVPYINDGWSVLFVEPSDAVMLQDEYLDLIDDPAVEDVAANSYSVLEYIDAKWLDDDISFDASDQTLTYHGHCNQKAMNKDHHAVGVLRRAGYRVDPLDSACCGMAGSFGYEAEHYDLSKAMGRRLFEKVDASDGDEVVAPGASCRSQLGDRPNEDRPPHPIEKVADALST